jgi:hypothetical protein
MIKIRAALSGAPCMFPGYMPHDGMHPSVVRVHRIDDDAYFWFMTFLFTKERSGSARPCPETTRRPAG